LIYFWWKLCSFISLPDYCRLLQNNNKWLFLSTENSLHCQYCFFISKNLLRALKQTKTCSKPPIIQIGLLWPLGFYQKTKKRWNRLKQNLIHVENWTGLSRQLEEVKSSRRCRLSQFRFRSPCVEVPGRLLCSACSCLNHWPLCKYISRVQRFNVSHRSAPCRQLQIVTTKESNFILTLFETGVVGSYKQMLSSARWSFVLCLMPHRTWNNWIPRITLLQYPGKTLHWVCVGP